MEHRIARFNERVTIQQNVAIVDKYGNHKNMWADYYTCFTYATTYQHDQESESETTNEQQTICFEVRYCEELAELDSVHFRISFHQDAYDILSVDYMNYQKKTIRIRCKLSNRS